MRPIEGGQGVKRVVRRAKKERRRELGCEKHRDTERTEKREVRGGERVRERERMRVCV